MAERGEEEGLNVKPLKEQVDKLEEELAEIEAKHAESANSRSKLTQEQDQGYENVQELELNKEEDSPQDYEEAEDEPEQEAAADELNY